MIPTTGKIYFMVFSLPRALSSSCVNKNGKKIVGGVHSFPLEFLGEESRLELRARLNWAKFTVFAADKSISPECLVA